MPRLARHTLALLLGITVVAAAPPTARAQTVDQELQRLADEGYQAYKDGKYDVAAADFARAYAIKPVPALLYNLARSYEQLGDVKHAYQSYQRYLDSNDKDPKPRRHAQEHLAALEPEYKALTAPKPVEPPKPVVPTPPPQTIVVTPIRQQPAGPTPEELAAARRHKRNVLLATGGAIAVVGLAGIGAGVGLYAAAASDKTQFSSSRDFVTKSSLKSDAESLATWSTVSYIAGGALVAVGATVALLGLRGGGDAEKAPAAGHATLAPVVAPGLAGLSLSGAF